MTILYSKTFGGEVPRLARRLLAPHQAQRALNCTRLEGTLKPLRAPLTVAALAKPGTK